MAKKFFLIDGHAQLYRAFFAVKGLTSPEGRPTNAVFGFATMLRKLIADHKPDFLAVAFDLPGPTFRHEMYPEYKATRPKPPDEFISQIALTRELIDAMGIPVLEKAGYEADDVLGTAARHAAQAGVDTVIVTGDKDATQLLGPHVSIYDSRNERFITAESFREAEGIAPEQVIEVMGLSGDSTDNVPGVPKVGPKTALGLIQQYGTMEEALRRADEVKGEALRRNLKEHAGLARLSRKLVTIDTNVPIEFDMEKCAFRAPDGARLAPLYKKLGFRQFLSEVAAPPTREKAEYRLVDAPERFEDFLAQLRRQKRFSLDTETTSSSPRMAKLVGISFSWAEKDAWYLPLMGPLGEKTLSRDRTLAALKPILEDATVAKTGQNLKYDAIVLMNYGIELRGIGFDTMVAAYVLNPERRRFGLDELASDLLAYTMTQISDLIGKGKKQITMDRVAVRQVCDYSCADADMAWRLTTILEEDLRRQGLWELFERIELPLAPVLARMEFDGIRLDAGALREMSKRLGEKMAVLEKQVYAEAGQEFNIGSPKQLSAILFDKFGLPRGRRTKTGASTDSDVLQQLAPAHRLPGLILEYRQLSKLKSTYADALPEMLAPDTGRLHTSFNQTATATGRLSSSDPNLQNIPIRSEIGEAIRRAFVPSRDDWLMLTADYSQIELRILAHICGDKAMRQAFLDDADIHQFVAAQIHGVKPDEVTPRMRRAAKAVNFGIVYGLTSYGLSRELQIPVEEADAFIKDYFERYPGVKRFIDLTIARAHEDGFVETLCGRRRQLPGLRDSDRATRAFAERAAVNTVIQGTAADMIKIAMIRIAQRLREEKMQAAMLLQIHDELVFELPPAEEAKARGMIVGEMAGALKLDVPVKVNVAIGKNWLEAK